MPLIGIPTPDETSKSNNGDGVLSQRTILHNTDDDDARRSQRQEEDEQQQQQEEQQQLLMVVVETFLTNLRDQVPKFLQCIETILLEKYDLDVTPFYADHVCWRTETMDEYTKLVSALRCMSSSCCTLLIESEIGGRLISTFQLEQGIPCCGSNRIVNVIEIPAPKISSPYPSGLEHVEFVIGVQDKDDNFDNHHKAATPPPSGMATPLTPMNNKIHESTLNAFMANYPLVVKWNTKAQKKEINPDVSLQLDLDNYDCMSSSTSTSSCSVKFHLIPLAEVIQYELSLDDSKNHSSS